MATLESFATHSFLFPTEALVALGYFSALEQVLIYMPRIELANDQPVAADEYRLLYQTRELGVYDVLVVCDVRLIVNEVEGILRLKPAVLTDMPVIEAAVKPDRTIATGEFSLEAVFTSQEEQTAVRLDVSIVSELPTADVPWFVPLQRIFRLVGRVAQERLQQSLVVFGRESVAAWQRANGSNWL